MVKRFERAVESMNDGLALISYSLDTSDGGKLPQRVNDLIFSTDFVLINPTDCEDWPPVTEPQFYALSSRPDYGLLPPSSYLFQAIPSDAQHFPDNIIEHQPELYAAIHKTVGSVANSKTISIPGSEDRKPLIAIAHCEHPLTQAVVVAMAESNVYGETVGIPISKQVTDADSPILQGVSLINQSRFARQLLENFDHSGSTAEWFSEQMGHRKRFIEGAKSYEEQDPPDGTMLAEAVGIEPITQGLLRTIVMVNAIHDLVMKDMDGNVETAAWAVNEAVERRVFE